MTGDILYEILTEDATVGAIVNDRVHPSAAPLALALPKITFEHVSTDPSIDNDGVHLYRHAFQVDVWATSYKGANDLAEAVINALQLHSSVNAQKILVTDAFDNAPAMDSGKESREIHRKTIRATIIV